MTQLIAIEHLHPVAQVVGLIVIGAIVVTFILSFFTDFFDKN